MKGRPTTLCHMLNSFNSKNLLCDLQKQMSEREAQVRHAGDEYAQAAAEEHEQQASLQREEIWHEAEQEIAQGRVLHARIQGEYQAYIPTYQASAEREIQYLRAARQLDQELGIACRIRSTRCSR